MQDGEMSTILAQISELKKQLSLQEVKIKELEQQLEVRKKYGFLITPLLLLSFSMLLVVFGFPSKEVQGKLVINPVGYNNQFGAIALPNGSTFTGSPIDPSAKFGIVASGNPTISLASLPIFDTGVYAAGEGYGVYATSSTSLGYGIYAINNATSGSGNSYGILGRSTKGIGVSGESTGNNAGVYGVSTNGPGISGQSTSGSSVFAAAGNGATLTIASGPTPISGTRQMGDIYVDTNGRIYIWAKDDTLTTSNWRKLQFGT